MVQTVYRVFRNLWADCTPKNNEKKSYKYMSYLSLFMRYNELIPQVTNIQSIFSEMYI